jgi:PAS domain S-box-containing protein
MSRTDPILSDGLLEAGRNGHERSAEDAQPRPSPAPPRAAVFSTDPDGRLTGWSAGAAALTGYPAEEVLGQPISCLFAEAYRELLQHEVRARLGQQVPYEAEVPLRARTGDTILVQFSLAPLRGPNGTVPGAAGFARELTEPGEEFQQLRASEERFRLAAEAADAFIYDVDLQTGRTFRSPGLCAVIGYQPEEVPPTADWWQSRIHPDDLPTLLVRTEAALAGENARFFDCEYRVLHRRGQYVHVWDRARIVRDRQGRAARLVGWTVNITEYRRAEERQRENEERHRLLSELTSDYIYTCRVGPDGSIRLEQATEGFTRITGYTVDELEARGGWVALLHPADLPASAEQMKQLLAGQRGVDELRIITKKGEVRWIRFSTQPIWDEVRGRVVRMFGAVQDITERKRAELRLHDYAQRLQALSRRLLEVQESERRHLARELHDEVAQTLTALSLNFSTCTRKEGAALRGALEEAQALVKELTGRVRDLSLRLRPTMLDDLGLLPALVWLLQRYQAQTPVQVQFQHSGLGRRFRHDVETAAYRVVQEALTNVARYAAVDAATVRLWTDRDRLYVQVEDHGVGFDLEAVRSAGATSGLSGMQERVELLGGRLTIDSVRGEGTCLTAELPLGAEGEKGPDDANAAAGR